MSEKKSVEEISHTGNPLSTTVIKIAGDEQGLLFTVSVKARSDDIRLGHMVNVMRDIENAILPELVRVFNDRR